jgi:hypothetical protein
LKGLGSSRHFLILSTKERKLARSAATDELFKLNRVTAEIGG